MEPIQTQHHPCLQKNAPLTPTPMHPLISNSSGIFNPTLKFGADCDYLPIYSLSPSLFSFEISSSSSFVARRASSLIYLPLTKLLPNIVPSAVRSLRSSIHRHRRRRRTTTEMTVGRASSIFDEGKGRPTERGKERHRKNLLMLQLL